LSKGLRGASKHRTYRLEIKDFTGGLNTETSRYLLKPNEAFWVENFLITPQGIERRKGFKKLFPSMPAWVKGAFAYGDKVLVVDELNDVGLYNIQTQGLTIIGQIDGNLQPKFAFFSPYVCIATGSSLWLFDTTSNTLTKTSSPKAVDVLINDGRVWIAGDDELWASRVGDPTDWVNDSGDPSSAQFYQIGYKDGGEIKGISLLYNDIIVFKTTGIFRFRGDPTAPVVSVITHKRSLSTNTSHASMFKDIIAIDEQGAYSITTVMRYGDMEVNLIDRKVSSFLRENYDGAVFYLPSLKAIAFRMKGGFLFYYYTTGAWGYVSTETGIKVLLEHEGKIYGFARKGFIYDGEYDETGDIYSATGEIAEAVGFISDTDVIQVPFMATYKTGTISRDTDILLKKLIVGYERVGDVSKEVGIEVSGIKLTIEKGTFSPYIASAQTEISEATYPISSPQSRGFVSKRQQKRVAQFDVLISSKTGGVRINSVGVNYAVMGG